MASERENAPVRREAHQGVESMVSQMKAKKENRSPKSRLYNEVSSELKAQALDVAINQQMQLLKKVERQGKVDLNNIDEVRQAVEDYFTSCKLAGVFPSLTALAPSMGYSRQGLNQYIREHSTETAHYLDTVRSAIAAIVEQGGLTRAASEAVAIFVLKNSVDMADKLDVTATPSNSNKFESMTTQEIEDWARSAYFLDDESNDKDVTETRGYHYD